VQWLATVIGQAITTVHDKWQWLSKYSMIHDSWFSTVIHRVIRIQHLSLDWFPSCKHGASWNNGLNSRTVMKLQAYQICQNWQTVNHWKQQPSQSQNHWMLWEYQSINQHINVQVQHNSLTPMTVELRMQQDDKDAGVDNVDSKSVSKHEEIRICWLVLRSAWVSSVLTAHQHN